MKEQHARFLWNDTSLGFVGFTSACHSQAQSSSHRFIASTLMRGRRVTVDPKSYDMGAQSSGKESKNVVLTCLTKENMENVTR